MAIRLVRKNEREPGMVEHPCNPSGWRTRSALETEFKVSLDYKTVSQKGGEKIKRFEKFISPA